MKVSILHACGHTTTHYLKGTPDEIAEATKKLKVLPCYACYINQQYEYAVQFATKHQYPKLIGGTVETIRQATLARFWILVMFGKRFDALVLESPEEEKRRDMVRRSIWNNLLNHEDTEFWLKWQKDKERLWEICGAKRAVEGFTQTNQCNVGQPNSPDGDERTQ